MLNDCYGLITHGLFVVLEVLGNIFRI